MRYMGGKSRISKEIAEVINNAVHGWEEPNLERNFSDSESSIKTGGGKRPFVSLFCGSCAIESKINADIKILNDKHSYLIAMWQALQNGWQPPEIITKDEYYYIKEHKDENPALTGFVGFGCSFGGRWFEGLARNKKGDNYCARAERSLMKDLQNLMDAKFTCLDYRDVEIPDGAVVYCDPPYENVKKFATMLGKFDHDAFWDYMRELSKTHTVFISEQTAPDDFECIWSKEQTRTLDYNKENQPKKIEKLFVWKG